MYFINSYYLNCEVKGKNVVSVIAEVCTYDNTRTLISCQIGIVYTLNINYWYKFWLNLI